ncbi:MAG: GDP-L-fucose synthase [Rhodothermaceae bacterium]|nr:GDP-L-fucose synthase [Rhodothermaceae bacterium]MYG68639.1 GDP-L-fucose synthase [Rhodothermaceae bacterium]MYJ45155.1 GDP-L-fucose synthase [Rhodothermaceae bacterium]
MHLKNLDASIYVAGHRGLLGRALVKKLRASGYTNLLLRTSAELDLRCQRSVNHFFEEERPEFVILAAARVGGILANDQYPADFLGDNLSIQNHVLDAAKNTGVKRLLFLGSTCIYPREAEQPLKETALLSGPLETTNRWYAVAKITGVVQCQALRRQHGCDFVTVMATNLYGPEDNFDLASSHVLPALMRKLHEAHTSGEGRISVWGSGTPRREFLYSEDMADACVFVLQTPEEELLRVAPDSMLNVGCGQDLSISDLCRLLQEVMGTDCVLDFDSSKPDGTPRKLVDVSRLTELGWTAPTSLQRGIHKTYTWYKSQCQ